MSQIPSVRAWPYRSVLFTPGHKLDWIRKTPKYDCDAVIIDLEDSVPPELKADARNTARAGIAFLLQSGIGAFVRINPLAEGGLDDVLEVVTAGLGALVVPKLASAAQVLELSELLAYAEGRAGLSRGVVDIVALPETAEGLCEIKSIASASPRVKSVMTGLTDRVSEDVAFTGDIAVAAGFVPTRDGHEQIYLASKVCLESRAGGAPFPLGTIMGTRIGDDDAARRIAGRIKAAGFTGCVCIHPSHVAIANTLFRPTRQECEFAAGVLRAMESARARGEWAVNFRGIMIDKASVELAERTIAEGRRYGIHITEETPGLVDAALGGAP